MNKIGIYSGTFDPVHKGHIGLALKAIEQAKLDEVYFIPEARPRHKTGVTHLGHRMAMIKIATRPYKKLNALELPDGRFDSVKTLPRLKRILKNSELFFLCGNDILEHMPSWPLVDQFLKTMNLIVGTKENISTDKLLAKLPLQPKKVVVISSPYQQISSSKIRSSLKSNNAPIGLPASLEKYTNDNWLYVLPSSGSSSSS